MRVSTSVGYALCAAGALTLLAGSQTVFAATRTVAPVYQPIVGHTVADARQSVPYAAIDNGRAGYQIVHGFSGCASGACEPLSALVAVNGELYGTALGGAAGLGSIYKVSFAGAEQLVYSFTGGTDGQDPQSSLLDVNGEMYGTTTGGSSPSNGTVFKVDTSGHLKTLYTFQGGTDGSTPIAGLILLHGMLYGTTEYGGASGHGTIFQLSLSGIKTILYNFKGGTDGANPAGDLIALNGFLYGTTFEGGAGAGFGTVFQLSAPGTERVIYRFLANGADGENPQAGVIAVNGELYGTTYWGGTSGYGTVFKVSKSGKESVMYSFLNNGTEGNHPVAPLIAANGNLYGTASSGGFASKICPSGCGSVFKISGPGKESVLHLFKDSPDAGMPVAPLIAANGALYGTTEVGGKPNFGTVFKISP